MDENGDSRVGLLESLKYRIKGGMMRERKYFGLLVMLLFAFVALPVPTIADTVTCPVGSPEGVLCASEIDGLGNIWTIASTATGGACKDKKNNAVTGTLFFYKVTVTDPGGKPIAPSLSQSNVDYDICSDPETDWNITYPTDRSIKKLDCDPNSLFRCDDPQKGVVTWSALKSFPDLHYEYSVCIEGASIKEATTRLETGNGYVDVFPTRGPGCCSQTQTTTQINSVIGSDPTSPTLTVDSGLCSFEPATVTFSGTESEPIVVEPLPGLAHCDVNARTGDIDVKSCKNITKFGPESGLYVLAKYDPTCSLDAEGKECLGLGYYGWGNKIYQFKLSVPYPGDAVCNNNGLKPVPRKGSMVVDDLVRFVYDGCGSGEIRDAKTDELLADPTSDTPTIWLVPYDSSGNLDLSQKAVIVSGSAEGVTFYGSSCFFMGRTLVCR